jgi:hypothetical protein
MSKRKYGNRDIDIVPELLGEEGEYPCILSSPFAVFAKTPPTLRLNNTISLFSSFIQHTRLDRTTQATVLFGAAPKYGC